MPPTPVKSRARLRVPHAAGRPGPSVTVTGFAAGVHGALRVGFLWYDRQSLCGRTECACADPLGYLSGFRVALRVRGGRTLLVGVTALTIPKRHARVVDLSMQCDALEHDWSC